jgi:outer membrane protein
MRARAAVLLFLFAAGGAGAQQAGDNLVQAGWLHVETLDSSEPLHTGLRPSRVGALLGIDSQFDSPGTSVAMSGSDTLTLTGVHYFSEHFALAFEAGIPAIFKLYGAGVVAPTGIAGRLFKVDLGAAGNNPLASVRLWSPALLFQWYVGPAGARWRPYLGLGFTYSWFTDLGLSPGFDSALNTRFGRVLALAAGKPGPTSVVPHAAPGWAPIFNAGVFYTISGRWGVNASLSYALLKTTARIDLLAADRTVLSSSTTRIDADSLVSTLLVSYALGL